MRVLVPPAMTVRDHAVAIHFYRIAQEAITTPSNTATQRN